jgi:hypothetical protein
VSALGSRGMQASKHRRGTAYVARCTTNGAVCDPTQIRQSGPPTIVRTTRPAPRPRPGADRSRRPEPSPADGTPTPQGLRDVPAVPPLSVKVKLFDENAPGEMVVAAVPVIREVWPRALDAHSLAILPRAPEALLAPVAQVLPRVRASKRHASLCGRVLTRVEP